MERVLTEALRNQFDSTLHMARVLVRVCPDRVWAQTYHDVPFWQQVYHYVMFIDFWMREDYGSDDWRSMSFGDAYTPDLYAESYAGLYVPRELMGAYLDAIAAKTARIFDELDDAQLSISVYDKDPRYSYIDVITGQIRHIMYNIGYLNGILRGEGLPESDWYAYNEPEGS